MNRDDLTEAQADKLHDQLAPATSYLAHLGARMVKRNFPHDDHLMLDVGRLMMRWSHSG